MKILIVKTSSMGDVVHAIPVLSDIRSHIPQAQIDWLVEESFADIPRKSPLVDQVITCKVRAWRKKLFDKRTRAEFSALKKTLKEKRYDLVIDLQGLMKSAFLAKLAGSPIAGYDRNSIREKAASFFYDRVYSVSRSLSAVERCRRLTAQALGYDISGEAQFVFSQAQGAHCPKQAMFFANTSRETKLWPQTKWIELGRNLAQEEWTILLAWGSVAEHERVTAIAEAIGEAARVLERMPIGQLMDYVSVSSLVVGLDTGMTHLSSAMGVATVGIFRDYPIELVPLVGNGKKKGLGGVDCCPEVKEVELAIKEITDGSDSSCL